MAEAPEVPRHVLEYLGERKTLTLATASRSGVPNAGTFMYVNDGLALYFWARPESTTAGHIEQNPLVALAIDAHADEPRATRGIQATGECRVVLGGDEIVRAIQLFSEKFTSASSGASTTNISFFRIAPMELFFIDNTRGRGEPAASDDFGFEYHREVAFSAFDALPEQLSEAVSATMHTIEVPAGDVVVREGAPADKFFIVIDGELELLRDERDGPRHVGTVGAGQFFGEMAILRDTTRSATVRATRPARLMVMERDEFRSLVAQSLGVSADFDSAIRRRLDGLGTIAHT